MSARPPLASGQSALPPPIERYTLLSWLHKNLFNSWYNALLTLLSVGVLYTLLRSFLIWAYQQAEWDVVVVNLRLIMVGQYPPEQLWRIWLVLDILALLIGVALGVSMRRLRAVGIVGLLFPFFWP